MAVEAGGIGARLRAGREKLGLTVLQVAERLHTDPKIVEAIEAENFEALGAPVYARGHIRHYAELVGESGSELNQLYSSQSKVAQPDLTRIVKVPAGTNSSKLVAPALLVIAIFAVAGAIWWVSALSKKKPQLSETHVVGDETHSAGASSPPASDASETTAGTPTPSQEPGQAGGAPTESAAPPGAMATQPRPGSPPAGAMAMQPRPGSPPPGAIATQPGLGSPPSGAMAMQPRPGSPAATSAQARSVNGGSSASDGSARGTSAAQTSRTSSSGSASLGTASTQTGAAAAQMRTAFASSPPAAGAAATAIPAAAPPRAKNQSQVTLRYSADSWTEVYDASGSRLFYDVGAANSVQTVVGTPPLRVVLGNASGVSVEYNGHSKPIASLSRPDGSVQFSINRSGQVVRAKPVADGG